MQLESRQSEHLCRNMGGRHSGNEGDQHVHQLCIKEPEGNKMWSLRHMEHFQYGKRKHHRDPQ